MTGGNFNAPMESTCIDPVLGVACIEEKMAECFRREIGIFLTFVEEGFIVLT